MPPEERWFWVMLTLFGAIFGTGLFYLFESPRLLTPALLVIVGAVGLGVLVRDRLRAIPVRTPLLVLGCGIIAIMIAYSNYEVARLGYDFHTYMTPRSVTPAQASQIRRYLSKYQPYAVSVVVAPNDIEAREYAGQLFYALRSTNWDVDPPDHASPSDSSRAELTGVAVYVDIPGAPPNPNPRKPTPGAIMIRALDRAHIINGNGLSAGTGHYSVTVVVGHRPLALNYGPTIIQRLGTWISSLGDR